MPLAVPRYTVGDLATFPDDGQRYELLDGILLVSPAPAERHQAILSRLMAPLLAAIVVPNLGRVASPGRILSGSTVSLEPDILVYPTPAAKGADWADVTRWWLAVEVLSPSTRVYDTEWKRQAYQAMGVECTWLVDPASERITVWQGGNPAGTVEAMVLRWTPRELPDVRIAIPVPDLFR